MIDQRQAAGVGGVCCGRRQGIYDDGVLGRAVAVVLVLDPIDDRAAGDAVAVGVPLPHSQLRRGQPKVIHHGVAVRSVEPQAYKVSQLDVPPDL